MRKRIQHYNNTKTCSDNAKLLTEEGSKNVQPIIILPTSILLKYQHHSQDVISVDS